MKKLVLTISIVLGLSMASFAQGGLFERGPVDESTRAGGNPMLPNHGETTDQPAPLGGGAAVLITLGAAYALAKKNRK